jgi:cyclophilin family peptidyl-prolyl cis-trans isomerase
MFKKYISTATSILLIFFVGCGDSKEKKEQSISKELKSARIDSLKNLEEVEQKVDEPFLLTEENVIDFFFEYEKTLKKDKVKLTTSLGEFTIQLFENVPYHRANFIYLTRQGYFNNTMFHRVVKGFIIQGGNSDNRETGKKRSKIGRYLLPPDGKKGHKHHRGVISMPSGEIDNPHKLASPYEFFIVVTKPGSYHLDGDYTPFGRVIQGMDVVDKINNVAVDDGDWPMQNVFILKAEVL